MFPVFDHEKKVYLPTFSVPADKVPPFLTQDKSKECEKIYEALHYKKVIEACEEKDEIVPISLT